MPETTTLERAAAKLRRLTGDLGDNRGPWYVGRTKPYPQTISNIGVPYVVASCFDGPQHPTVTGDYIAAMHPGVGAALAAWLESVADRLAQSKTHPDWQEFDEPHALAVANLLLATPTP